jgi:hypothetical protein
MTMAPRKTKKKAKKPSKRNKTLTLKKVEAELKDVLAGLKQQLNQNPPNPSKGIIEEDILKVQALMDGLPNSCHKNPAYNVGI